MDQKKRLIIKKTATGKNTLLLGFLLLILAFFIMPEARQQIGLYAHGTGMIDSELYFSPDQAYQMIEAYSEKGRQLYIAVELTADLFYTIVTALFLCSLLIWSSSIAKNGSIKLIFLIWLPSLLLLVNCLENAAIIWMLSGFPEKYFYLALLTSFFSIAKLILILSCLCIAGWNLALYSSTKFDLGLKINHENSATNKH